MNDKTHRLLIALMLSSGGFSVGVAGGAYLQDYTLTPAGWWAVCVSILVALAAVVAQLALEAREE